MREFWRFRFSGILAFSANISTCLIVMALAIWPAMAADDSKSTQSVTLEYTVYIGGFETINFSFDTALSPSDYKMKMALDGQGVLNWWFSWRMSAFSEGQLASGGIMPVRAGHESHWNGKHRRTRLSYTGTGAPTTQIEPVSTDDDRTPVPPELRAGALDLAGAVLAGMSQLSASVDNSANGKGSCDIDEPVFDGRRRYNLVLEHLGRDVLEKNDYSVFSGPALRCGVKIDRIAGFRRNPPTSKWRKSDGATLWVGRAFANFPPVPVRLELETLLGALRVHLVRASLTEGGEIRRLAAVR